MKKISDILNRYRPITLAEMEGIKLMNRTDTKFVTTTSRLLRLLEMAIDGYRVQEIDGRRIANYYTLYFDTTDNKMYSTHQAGHTNRQKLRIRSYVDSGLNFLEVKTKNNHGRTKKKRTDIADFDPINPARELSFGLESNEKPEHGLFLSRHLRLHNRTLSEKVENRFKRITLVNNNKTERLTIDFGLQFHNIETNTRVSLPKIVIIELKRDGLVPSPIFELLRRLRIKPMGFSKYCMGAALTNPDLKRNRFKERLMAINHISRFETLTVS